MDFWRFSCGNWNKLNPIPPDQARWSVYGKLAQENLQYLWGVLEAAAKPSPGRTPNEQKIGDFFGACMNEPAVEQAGAAPLKPTLDAIAGLSTLKDLPPVLARMHLGSARSNAIFGFGAVAGFRQLRAGNRLRLGRRTGTARSRLLHQDRRRKVEETRAKYLAHVARMFELLGDAPAAAKAQAQTVMDIETALAKASLTRVELRDPYKLFHKMPRAKLAALTPSFGWAAYWKASGLADTGMVNVTEPAFYAEVETQLKARPIADWKTYLRWHAGAQSRALPLRRFRAGEFRFLQQTPARHQGAAAALEALRPAGGPESGRSAGAGLRGEDVHRRREGTGARHDQRDRNGDGSRPAPAPLDERTHTQKGAGKTARHGEQDRLPRPVARL